MADPEILKRETKALVFDQYGTIVDMQSGLTEIAAPFLKRKGWKEQLWRKRDSGEWRIVFERG